MYVSRLTQARRRGRRMFEEGIEGKPVGRLRPAARIVHARVIAHRRRKVCGGEVVEVKTHDGSIPPQICFFLLAASKEEGAFHDDAAGACASPRAASMLSCRSSPARRRVSANATAASRSKAPSAIDERFRRERRTPRANLCAARGAVLRGLFSRWASNNSGRREPNPRLDTHTRTVHTLGCRASPEYRVHYEYESNYNIL